MRTISIKLNDMAIANIQLGFVGEDNATQVIFESESIFNEHPDAVQLLVVTPPEGTTYEVTTARVGDNVVWNVSDLDTAFKGEGSLQLTFTDDSHVIKTYNAATTVLESQVPSGTAPDSVLNWIEDAEAWATGKRGGKSVEDEDPAYHNNSKYYSEQAEIAKTSAESAKDDAVSAKTDAETAKTAAEAAQAAAEAILPETITDWLEENITSPEYPLDRTLSLDSAAAPADMVGNIKSAFEAEQEINETEITLAFDDYEIVRRYITDQGGWSTPSSSSTIRSACVRIPDGCTRAKVTTTGEANHYVAFLSSDTGFTDGSGLSPQFSASYIGRILLAGAQEKVFDCYSDVKYIWFMTASSTGVDITPGIVFYIDAKESIELLLKNEGAVLANGTVSKDAILNTGAWAATSSSGSFKSSCVRVPVGTKTVEVSYENGTIIAFLKNLTNRRSGGSASFSDDYTSRITFSSEGTKKYIIGTDVKWVYTNMITNDGTDVTPTIVFKPDILRNGDMPDIEEYTNGKFFNIMPTLYEGWFNWKLHFSYLSGGSTNSADGFATTEPIAVVPGNQVVNISATEDENENAINFYIVEFNGDTFVRRYTLASGSQYVVPSGVTAIRFMFGFASASNVSITKNMLSKFFAVKFLSVAAQNDFETPTYVAYGASTTIGAVHRFTGQGTFYSMYSYPDYICRALNLRGYNHGHGSTGFLARSDGDVPNIMDCIYADGDLLAKAGLVTIMFGYGNDRTAGLPIGLYDDYYPYDAEGYHPSGSAGISTMLSNGATLMGCLNWCIKWISEHYPTITLVVIFGSPSANEDRAVTVVANPDETAGRPPYKLNIVQPYVDNDPQPYSVPSTSAKGMAQIKTELDKLKAALNIPVVDLFFDGLNINAYNAKAKDDDGMYAIFSTTGTADDQTTWTWNSHPNNAGYKMYAEFIAGKVISLFKH